MLDTQTHGVLVELGGDGDGVDSLSSSDNITRRTGCY